MSYKFDDKAVEMYERAWQCKGEDTIDGIKALDYDTQILDWYKNETELRIGLLKAYEEQFKNKLTVLQYEEKCKNAKCSYCDITEQQIALLKANGKIKTKRSRGDRMEIDRLNSNGEYNLDNIVLACYWCNNAKTDEFTPTEFAPIALQIKAVWQARLKATEI